MCIWLEFEKSGRGIEVLGLCDRDVVWLVPGLGLIRGIEDVRSFLCDQPETKIIAIETFDVEVEVARALAVKTAVILKFK